MTAKKKRASVNDHQMVKRRLKNEYNGDVYFGGYDLEGTPAEAITQFQKLIDLNPGKSLSLSWEEEPYDDNRNLYVYENRLETDDERDERVGKVKQQTETQKARDLAELDRLKRMYEKN